LEDGFPTLVRSALARMYDLPYLQTHALASRAGGGKALQRCLREALDALRSGPGPGGRTQRLLALTYAEALSAGEVGRRLGLSKSVYYREHARGVAAVAGLLRERWEGPSDPADVIPPTQRPGALPGAMTSFVGREGEVAALRALLRAERLVTLTGPPGSGKTRLAVETARALVGETTEEVRFVPLAPVADPDLVPAAIARALGLPERGGAAQLGVLAAALADRRLLLLVDNCEHVLSAGPAVAALVLGCPGLRALVTSREPLRVTGEHVFPVPPLALPGAGDAAAIRGSEAVALFVLRARAAIGTFELSPENAVEVAGICRGLDGLPLAIELAAARVRHLPLAALRARIDRALPLLTTGPTDAPSRQRTLRAAITWSYDLLSDGERALFRRLAVFAGGCTLAAAGTVCGGPPWRGEIFDGLSSLTDKNLVVADDADGQRRFRLLEVLRQFGLEQLAMAGEVEATRRRHATWMVGFAGANEPAWGREQAARIWRIESERDNVRAALAWAVEADQAETGLLLASRLLQYWRLRGLLDESVAWFGRLWALPSTGAIPSDVRAPVVHAFGLLKAHGPPDRVAGVPDPNAMLGESLALWRAVGDKRREAWVLADMALTTNTPSERGAEPPRWDTQAQLAGLALALFREVGDEAGAAAALWQAGGAAYGMGDWADAASLRDEALAAARRSGDDWHAAQVLLSSGVAAEQRGDAAAARPLLVEALALFQRVGEEPATNLVRFRLGYVAVAEGKLAEARAWFGAGQHQLDAATERRGFQGLVGLGRVALAEGDPVAAARLFERRLRLRSTDGRVWDVRSLPDDFLGMIAVAVALDDWPRAAELAGACASTVKLVRNRATPGEERELAAVAVAARAALGEAAYRVADAAGGALDVEAAIRLALDWASSPRATTARPGAPFG
jgi:predicted ATPase